MEELLSAYEDVSRLSRRLFAPPAPSPPPAPASIADLPAARRPARGPAAEGLQLQIPRYSPPQPRAKAHAPWKLKRVVIGHKGWVRCLALDPSNEFFASGSVDCTVKFWDLASCALRLTLTGHVAAVRCVEFAPRHVYLFSGSEDKEVRCWDLNTNQTVRVYHGHLSGVNCLAAHPSQSVFASGGRDGAVRLWDVRTREQVMLFEGHRDAVNAVRLQEDEPQLVSASADATARFWDLLTGRRFQVLTEHKKGIRGLALHPGENALLTVAADSCKHYRLPGGGFVRSLSPGAGKVNNCADIAGEDVVAIGSHDGTLSLWDWESGEAFQVVNTPPMPGSLPAENSIFDLKFDLSGLRLLSAEGDKTIKIYEQTEGFV